MPRRLPKHVGFIPDGNRRWAEKRGLPRQAGYAAGIEPGLRLLEQCHRLGIEEVSAYGFTRENVRRPGPQVEAFRLACVEFGLAAVDWGAALRVVGDASSPVFPSELRPFAATRVPGRLRLNLLVNYGWQWDLSGPPCDERGLHLHSADVPRIDLVVRWGGHQRLSGFLPVQCAYADFAFVETLWPDMTPDDLVDVLAWYERQDVTLGG